VIVFSMIHHSEHTAMTCRSTVNTPQSTMQPTPSSANTGVHSPKLTGFCFLSRELHIAD
jgi:hypothetical protein